MYYLINKKNITMKAYIKPEMSMEVVAVAQMMALSDGKKVGFGSGTKEAGLSNGRRNTWSNGWDD